MRVKKEVHDKNIPQVTLRTVKTFIRVIWMA